MQTERKTFVSRWRPRVLLIALAALAVFLSMRIGQDLKKRREINDEIVRLELEAKRLENRNLEILELSKQLTTTEFLEREARLKLGLQKPGELVAVLSKEPSLKETLLRPDSSASRQGNAQRWWFYFFDQDRLRVLREERQKRGLAPYQS